jgi:hypothetical protein
MGRSLLAIATGFILIAALSIGTDVALMAAMPSLYEADGSTTSLPVLLLTIAYVGLYATGGCYLSARLAPAHPMRHALILGVLGLIFNIAGSVSRWNMAPAWYHLTSIALVMCYAVIGGRLREQELASRAGAGLSGAPFA